MTRRRVELSEEDRIVWTAVARTAKPLKGKALPVEVAIEVETKAESEKRLRETLQASPAPVAKPPAKPQAPPRHFDQQTRDKLTKGRLPIEARVDLHGMTQGEAHGLLFSFLQQAHAAGVRYVLVITGKGSSFGSDGALKRAVPAWLATPLFRPLVSGHDDAARQHGGTGALYVRLRREIRSQ